MGVLIGLLLQWRAGRRRLLWLAIAGAGYGLALTNPDEKHFQEWYAAQRSARDGLIARAKGLMGWGPQLMHHNLIVCTIISSPSGHGIPFGNRRAIYLGICG